MKILEEKIQSKVNSENKLSCRDALEIANELDISPASVGKEVDRLKIKIFGCQLGCFK